MCAEIESPVQADRRLAFSDLDLGLHARVLASASWPVP
jgi:hypothetical protein